MIICAFLIPIVLWFFALMISSVYIGSENTLFVTDMLCQYTGFFEFLKSILNQESEFFYSFAYGLGGEVLSLIAYYLASPFNLLVKFFEIPEAVYIISLLKIGCCGLTFCLFLQKKFNNKYWMHIAFSTCYALMSYNIVYQINLMWLDGVIWFPIVILGIDRLFEKNKTLLLYISLSITIISNWYIGYMVCLGAGVYAIYLLLPNFKDNYKKFLKFILIGVLCAGTSSIVILPSLYAQMYSMPRIAETFNSLSQVNFPIFDIFQKFIIGSFSFEQITSKDVTSAFLNLPNVYCSVFCVFMCILYFFNRNINKVDKMKDGILLLFFLFSCSFNLLNTIWHVGVYNIWFPYRWSFIISFFLILIAYKSYNSLKNLDNNIIVKSGIIIILLCFFIEKINYSSFDNGSIYISVIFLVAYILLFTKLSKSKIFIFATIFMVCFEMFINSIVVFRHIPYYGKDEYISEIESVNEAIEKINNTDKGYYRIGNNIINSYTYLFGKNILSIESSGSTQPKSGIELLKKLGIEPYGTINLKYSNTTEFNNDILGIKYFIGEYTGSDFEKTEIGENVWINSDALSLGFSCSKKIKNIKNFLSDKVEFDNPFDTQNIIANNMDDINGELFNKIDIFDVSFDNLYVFKSDENILYNTNMQGQAVYSFNFISPNDNKVYLNMEGIGLNNLRILINDKDVFPEKKIEESSIIDLGCFGKNEIVNVKIKIMDEKYIEIQDTQVYWFNDELYNEFINNLRKNQFEILEMSNSKIKGKINIEENKELLLFSILYDDFLKIKVDGKEVETIKILDSVIGIELLTGEHNIEIWYEPILLRMSVLISSMFSIISIMIIFIGFKTGKK